MMNFKYLVLLYLLGKTASEEQLYLLKSIRTDYLQNFMGYTYVTVMHFSIPSDTEFASFRFQAEQTSFSLFGCDKDEIILHMKHGSIPVINADHSKNPVEFFNASHSKYMYLEFSSDKKYHYINITTPAPGSYYATAFHPFVDPDSEAITQSGLSKVCSTFIDANLYIQKYFVIDIGKTSGVTISATLDQNETQTYKFFIPEGNDRLVLVLTDVTFCKGCTELTAKIHSDSSEKDKQGLIRIFNNTYESKAIYYHLWTQDNSWYYILFNFTADEFLDSDHGKVNFEIKAFPSINKNIARQKYGMIFGEQNLTSLFGTPLYKSFYNDYLATRVLYKEYDLVRSGKTESFFYSFDLHPDSDGSLPIAVNLTSEDYTTLKFYLSDAIDIGGTINFILAFAPKIKMSGKSIVRIPEPSSHTVIACVRNSLVQVPDWPDKCSETNNENVSDAAIILNKTTTNSTIMLPFPENGWWYVSLKLYCNECISCSCSDDCRKKYKDCVSECERTCEVEKCNECESTCEVAILKSNLCKTDCDCDGNCQRTETSCNTSVLFDISSYPCVTGKCGKNGRCVFMVTEGIVYSTCLCSNKYKGWDCNDDSDATSYGLLVLEMCLLVISNVIFLPATYFAFRRKYYVESVVYFSTFLFSSLYHACDAGENVINYCIVKFGVLQFSDFFSGLLSIWVTLIAMAYIKQPYISIAHITGCIVFAFGTTYNKTSIWVFLIPVLIGLVILIGNWWYMGRTNKCLFPSKHYLIWYLPPGLIVVFAALLTFALFQTQSNYKYLHSLWHILMAVGVIILLPKMDEFLPPTLISNSRLNNSGQTE